MKHRENAGHLSTGRRALAATALTLALSGGLVGQQLAEARQPATASSPSAHAPRGTAVAGATTSPARTPAPTTPTAAAVVPGSSTATTPKATTPKAATSKATTSTATAPKAATSTATTAVAPTRAPASSTSTVGSAPATSAAGASGNPLAGATFYGPNTGAAAAARSGAYGPADSALLSQLAGVPTALWLGSWSGDVTRTVRDAVTAAQASGAVPVLVAYNVPDTDCGGYSAGGAASATEYATWVQQIAAGIGSARAVVVVEPDALAQLCGDPARRYALLDAAIDVLETNPGTLTYLDAGNPTWIGAAEMAKRLRAAGVDDADGFSLNVSNFETTAANVSYGQALSAALGGAHFVIDTSRNGNGPGSDWCNPGGRAVGERPTSATGQALVDAYLWVKRTGESDGTCNGGPAAGIFWPQYALGLMRN